MGLLAGLKAIGVIDWSWWVISLPTIILLIGIVLLIIVGLIFND